MAEIIPAEILDAAFREIADISNDEAQAKITWLCSAQPALFSYFMTMTEDSSEDERAFVSHMFLAIHQVFDKQFGGRLQNVGLKRVEQIADHNEQAITPALIQLHSWLLPPNFAFVALKPLPTRAVRGIIVFYHCFRCEV